MALALMGQVLCRAPRICPGSGTQLIDYFALERIMFSARGRVCDLYWIAPSLTCLLMVYWGKEQGAQVEEWLDWGGEGLSPHHSSPSPQFPVIMAACLPAIQLQLAALPARPHNLGGAGSAGKENMAAALAPFPACCAHQTGVGNKHILVVESRSG